MKLGMKLPGGTVYEVERLVRVEELNLAVDATNILRRAIIEMAQEFMDRLPSEKDAR
jgi:hypothetical protein